MKSAHEPAGSSVGRLKSAEGSASQGCPGMGRVLGTSYLSSVSQSQCSHLNNGLGNNPDAKSDKDITQKITGQYH